MVAFFAATVVAVWAYRWFRRRRLALIDRVVAEATGQQQAERTESSDGRVDRG